MFASRTTPLRLVCGAALALAFAGCDSQTLVLQPEQPAAPGAAAGVSLAEKEAAVNAVASHSATPMSAFYTTEPIPFVAGPTGLANLGPVCDDCVMNDVPIGFNFTFYGNTYSTLQISSNGFVRFAAPNNDSGCCSGRVIPNNDLWNNIIAFAWTDLIPIGGESGNLRWETFGSAPNRRFVLHSDNVRYFGGTGPNLIQWLTLHEGTNVIEIHTQLMTPRVITQGIENEAGADADFLAGRVATTFSLANDGVRFTPLQVSPVPIHDAYSGDPRRDPGIINLGDDWVYVEILDVLTHMSVGTVRSANDVRIGASFATGVPANSFSLVNIGGSPAQPDFRGRWSRQALQDAGLLPVGATTLVVWGGDPNTGRTYRGTHEVTVELPGTVLYDNGPWITHPGAGAGGADVHMAATNFLASNARRIGAGPHFRIADRFTIPAGGANVSTIVTRALINDLATPAWNFFSMNIWDGRPGDPGSNIIASSSSATFAWTGAYGVFQGDPLGGTNFPIFNAFFDTPGLALAAGDYWIDWQIDGSNAWAIYVTHPNPGSPNQPILGMGVGRQLVTGGVWQDLLQGEAGVPHTPGTPFLVIGQSMGGASGPVFRRVDAGVPATAPRVGRLGPPTQPHLRN